MQPAKKVFLGGSQKNNMPKGIRGFQKGHTINKGRIPWDKGKKGLLLNDFFTKHHPKQLGSENPNWRGGISKIGECLDCGKKLKSYPSKYCHPCSFKHRISRPSAGEKHYKWKGGRPTCLKCGKKIEYRAKYCSACRSRSGEKNPNWHGGKSFEPYPLDWKEKLKILIRERDSYTCKICDKPHSVDIHHIDYNKDNCGINNLITLCHKCHSKTNFNRDNWINYFKKHE